MAAVITKSEVPQCDPNFVEKDAYISREFAELEKKRLWPRVWQVAGREEELPGVGDYIVYEVCDETIVLVRTATDRIQAFFNACAHRGRKLVSGHGRIKQFVCRFHGWRYDLCGANVYVQDKEDWEGSLDDHTIQLTPVKVESWGGFVFVNPDPEATSLREFLGVVPEIINPFRMDEQRFRWYKTIVLACNWKVGLEAFNEVYHVAQTHPQLMASQGEDYSYTKVFGKHSRVSYDLNGRPPGAPSPRTGLAMPDDLRPGLVAFSLQLNNELKALITEREMRATTRLMTEVPNGTPPHEVLMKASQFQAEAAIAEGAGWPSLTAEHFVNSGMDWHVFPNLIFLPSPAGALVYRVRPNGDDPHSCIFDIWSLGRYAPGTSPALNREFYPLDPEGKPPGVEIVGKILSQDFSNMTEVQRGMRSQGFKGSRTNPKQELPVANFHRVLREYIEAA